MNNVTSVLAQAKALSKQEQQELLTQLEEYLVLGSQVAQVTKEVKEMRFSKGRVCCHCNGTDVVRNGKRNSVQRYLCRNCNSSFSDLTNSATYRSSRFLIHRAPRPDLGQTRLTRSPKAFAPIWGQFPCDPRY